MVSSKNIFIFHNIFDKIFISLLRMLLLFLNFLLATSDSTCSSGGDKTDFLTSTGVTSDSRGFTDMLVITTTVRMFDGIHGNTTNFRPAVALHLVLVIGATGFQYWFIDTATSGNDSYHSSVGRRHDFLSTRW